MAISLTEQNSSWSVRPKPQSQKAIQRMERTNSRTRPSSCCLVASATSQRNLVAFSIVHRAFLSAPNPFTAGFRSRSGAQEKIFILFLTNQQLNHHTANTFITNSSVALQWEKLMQNKELLQRLWEMKCSYWISFYTTHISQSWSQLKIIGGLWDEGSSGGEQ